MVGPIVSIVQLAKKLANAPLAGRHNLSVFCSLKAAALKA